jgi:hypothetical protein
VVKFYVNKKLSLEYWNAAVLEYWFENGNIRLNNIIPIFHYSTIPVIYGIEASKNNNNRTKE